MAKFTPPKSPIVYDKQHHSSGCMWGLYSLFEFRQGNSTRKLISDAKQVQSDFFNYDGNVKKLSNVLGGFDEKNRVRNDDMSNEKRLKKEESNSTNADSELGESSKDKGKTRKTNQGASKGQTDPITQKKKCTKKKKGCGCKNVDFVNYNELLKANDATEAIVNKKLIEGKWLSRDGLNNNQSKQLLDALSILNSNKELFAKLLRDPDSLLVKHIEDLRVSQARKQNAMSSSSSTECEPSCNNERHRHKELDDSETVVLKPGSINDMPTQFSFGDMKRKFSHDVGATRNDPNLTPIEGVKRGTVSSDDHDVTRKFRNDVRLGNKNMENHFSYDALRNDKIEKLRDFKTRIGQEMAATVSSELSREINNDDHKKQAITTTKFVVSQRTIFSPEFDFLSSNSHARDVKSGSVSSQMRFSPYGYSQVSHDNWRLTKEHTQYTRLQVFDADSRFKGEANPLEVRSESNDLEKSNAMETCAARNSEETSDTSVSKETISSNQSSDSTYTNEESEDSESSRLDSSLEDQSSTCSSSNVFSSTPSSIHRVGDHGSSIDIGESSPISVLEQFFTDGACTPSNTGQTDEEQISSNLANSHLDPKMHLKSSTFGTMTDFVESILQSSGWSSCEPSQALDPLLLGSLISRASQFCGDCKLLFDCINEVFVELREARFSRTPWLSFSYAKTLRPLQAEATKRIELLIKPESSSPTSMECLIGNDLRRSGSWLDIRTDAEEIVCEIADDALEELIMEFVFDGLHL